MSVEKKSSKRDTKKRILEKAIESFQTLGYARSTTHAIAGKAGVAEITLFRHFGDKKKLFQIAVKEIAQDVPWEIIGKQLSGDIQEDLQFIAKNMINFFTNQRNAISMLMFESGNFPEMRNALAQNPAGTIKFLSGYFKNHMENGTITADNPAILSQLFISMFFGYAMGLENIRDLLKLNASSNTITKKFVNIFLQGIII